MFLMAGGKKGSMRPAEAVSFFLLSVVRDSIIEDGIFPGEGTAASGLCASAPDSGSMEGKSWQGLDSKICNV